MKLSQAERILIKLINIRQNGMLVSRPGVGKTALVKSLAEKLNMDLIWSHPSISDPTDYKGMPAIVNGEAHFLPFNDLKALIKAKRPTICFVDDLGQSPTSVQAPLMQLLWERRVNGFRLSDHVVFILATNRAEDKAGVSTIIEPLKNRCAILQIDFDLEVWCNWALESGVSVDTVAFNRFRRSFMETWSPAPKEIKAVPTPRSVHIWDDLYKIVEEEDVYEACASVVGEAYAIEFSSYLKIRGDLPTWDEIVKRPDKARLPKKDKDGNYNMGAMYAIATMAGRNVDTDTLMAAVTYMERAEQPEMIIMMLRDAIRRDKNIQMSPEFRRQVIPKYKSILLD